MKLLTRNISAYLLYAIIIILIAIPAIYFVIQEIVSEEIDEGLIAQKHEVMNLISRQGADIDFQSLAAGGIILTPAAFIDSANHFFNKKIYDKISNEKIPYRILESNISVVNNNYTISLKHSLVDKSDLIRSIAIMMSILLVLIVAGFLIINKIISKTIWQPFYKTVHQLNAYTIADPEILTFDKTKIDEFNDLNNTISLLIQRNVSAYNSQKEFTENASHEM